MNDNDAAPTAGQLYDTKAAAARLALDPQTLVKMAREGEIGHYRVGKGRGVLRFSDGHLRDYLAAREVTPKGRVA